VEYFFQVLRINCLHVTEIFKNMVSLRCDNVSYAYPIFSNLLQQKKWKPSEVQIYRVFSFYVLLGGAAKCHVRRQWQPGRKWAGGWPKGAWQGCPAHVACHMNGIANLMRRQMQQTGQKTDILPHSQILFFFRRQGCHLFLKKQEGKRTEKAKPEPAVAGSNFN